jgi:hypothetical protein
MQIPRHTWGNLEDIKIRCSIGLVGLYTKLLKALRIPFFACDLTTAVLCVSRQYTSTVTAYSTIQCSVSLARLVQGPSKDSTECNLDMHYIHVHTNPQKERVKRARGPGRPSSRLQNPWHTFFSVSESLSGGLAPSFLSRCSCSTLLLASTLSRPFPGQNRG